MKKNILAFVLGIVLAYQALPRVTHLVYWLLIVVAFLLGYKAH